MAKKKTRKEEATTILGLELFRAMRKDNKKNDKTVTTRVAYPTGYSVLDYRNGEVVEVYDEDDEVVEVYHNIGLVGGTMITVIGNSGTGKSTLVQQMSTGINAQFSNKLTPYHICRESYTIHEDVEKAGATNRTVNVSNLGAKWSKDHYEIYEDCSTEEIVDRFVDHCNMKVEDLEAWSYDTGRRDIYGDPIIDIVPTCVIIDSLATMTSKEINLDSGVGDSTGNMTGARKRFAALFSNKQGLSI